MNEAIRIFFKKRWVRIVSVLICALAIGFIYILAHAAGYKLSRSEGQAYVPETPIGSNEIHYILPRFREAYDGYLWVADADLWEGRFGPAIWPRLTPLLMLPFYAIFDGPWHVFWGDVMLAAIFFVLVFWLFYGITRRWFASLLFSTIFILSHQLPRSIFAFLRIDGSFVFDADSLKVLVKTFLPVHIGSIYSTRVDFLLQESYKPGFLILGPFLLLIFYVARAAESKRKTIIAVVAGVFAGLLIYTYSFFWIFANVVIGILALWATVRRDWREVLIWLGALGAGLLVTVEYWINYLVLHALPYATELFARMTAMEHGHSIIWSLWPWYLIYLVLAILVMRWGNRHGRPAEARVLAAMLLSCIVLFNIQAVLGVTLAGEHWHSRVTIIPLALALAALGGWGIEFLWRRFPTRHTLIGMCGLALFISQIIGASHLQLLRARKDGWRHMIPEGMAESLLWMDKQLPRDSVVLTPSFFSNSLISYYTTSRIFVPRGDISIVPTGEILERFFITTRLLNLDKKAVAAMFVEAPSCSPIAPNETERLNCEVAIFDHDADMHIFAGLMISSKVSASLRSEQLVFSAQERQKIVNSYGWILTTSDANLANLLQSYRADYLYVGPTEHALGAKDFSAYNFLERVYDSHGVAIYRIRRE